MSILDLSLPLSTLMHQSTQDVHRTLGSSPGSVALLHGRLPKEEYIRYLMMLFHVYGALEQALDQHATHPTLEHTYNPTLFARELALSADIAYLLDVPESSWKSHPIHLALLKDTPQALKVYVDRVRELAESPDPSPLLGHAYVRYLGDLSGGQRIRYATEKAYGLDRELSFYSFKELTSTKPATLGEMKHIKEWFKEGMNRAGEQREGVKGRIEASLLDAMIDLHFTSSESVVREALNAFQFNGGLFSTLQPNVA